jgi:hypothetical protein
MIETMAEAADDSLRTTLLALLGTDTADAALCSAPVAAEPPSRGRPPQRGQAVRSFAFLVALELPISVNEHCGNCSK